MNTFFSPVGAPQPPGMGAPHETAGTAPMPPAIPQVTPVATGTPGIDLLQDLPGDTDLHCGPNRDLLLFGDGSGFDVVFGFDPSDTGDMIAIQANVNGSGLYSADQLAIADTEYGALVDLGGGNGLLIAGVPLDQLDPTDFAIQPPIDSGAAVF